MTTRVGSPDSLHDLVVIGGGPAGLIAAGRAASLGASVLLLEKNRETGRKLLISGGGRCNVTNVEPDIHRLVARYGDGGKALYSVLAGFGPIEMLAFLHEHGVETSVEAEQRAFPSDDRAESIRNALLRFCRTVDLRCATPVASVETVGRGCRAAGNGAAVSGARFLLTTASGQRHGARFVLVATGGYARPDTGSTGDGFAWLRAMGHRIIVPEPILVPIRVRERWCSELMGLSFPECGLAARPGSGGAGIREVGKVLFTHFGLSGPLVLNAGSRLQDMAELIRPEPLIIELDFFPAVDGGTLDRTILETAERSSRKQVGSLIAQLLPPRLAARVLTVATVSREKRAAELSRADRKSIVSVLKAFPLTYAGRLGNDKAIVSRGGISIDEVDFKTMESRLAPGLLLAGDVLDFDRPSGGFSLQICWSTGWRAGETAAG